MLIVFESSDLFPIIQEHLSKNILRQNFTIDRICFNGDSAEVEFSLVDPLKAFLPNDGNHKEKPRLPCPVCGEKFELLRLHLTRKHPEITFTDDELADLTEHA